MPRSPVPLSERHRQIARGLIDAAAHALPAAPNPYIEHHLAGHLAEAGTWDDLADAPEVLDHLDPTAVAAEALRTGFGRSDLPVPIAATLAARDLLASVGPEDREGIRAIAAARFTGSLPPGEDASGGAGIKWAVRWARLRRDPLHVILTTHRGEVNVLRAIPMPDGQTLLAIGTEEGGVQLWDPVAGAQTGEPLIGDDGRVTALEIVPLPDGRTLLAVAVAGRGTGDSAAVQLWDPVSRTRFGEPLTDSDGPIGALKAIRLPDGRTLLAVAGLLSPDGRVRLWDPLSGTVTRPPLTGHEGPVQALETVSLPNGRVLLAVGTALMIMEGSGQAVDAYHGRLWLWDVATGQVVHQLRTAHHGPVSALAVVPLREGRVAVATGGRGGAVRLFDPQDGALVGEWLHGNADDVVTASTMHFGDGRAILASAGSDHTVRLWDPVTGAPVGVPLSGHGGRVRAMTGLQLADGRTFAATAGEDGTVRLWDPVSSAAADDPLAGSVGGMAAIPGRMGKALMATVSAEGTVQMWEPSNGTPMGQPLKGYPCRPLAVPVPDGRTLVALGGVDRPVQLWDPETRSFERTVRIRELLALGRHPRAVAAVPLPDGRTALAMLGSFALWLVDPASGRRIRRGTRPVRINLRFESRGGGPVNLPDGESLLFTTNHFEVQLWQPTTGTLVGEWVFEHRDATTGVTAVSRDDGCTLLAVSDADGTTLVGPFTESPPVRKLRAGDTVGIARTGRQRGAMLSRIRGEVPAVTALRTHDGRTLVVTGGPEGVLRLWDPETGALVHTLPLDLPTNALLAMDGLLIIGSEDGLVALEIRLPPSET